MQFDISVNSHDFGMIFFYTGLESEIGTLVCGVNVAYSINITEREREMVSEVSEHLNYAQQSVPNWNALDLSSIHLNKSERYDQPVNQSCFPV